MCRHSPSAPRGFGTAFLHVAPVGRQRQDWDGHYPESVTASSLPDVLIVRQPQRGELTRARWQKALRVITFSRLVAPCPKDARAPSAVVHMTLRMQFSIIRARSLEPAHLCAETDAPLTAIPRVA